MAVGTCERREKQWKYQQHLACCCCSGFRKHRKQRSQIYFYKSTNLTSTFAPYLSAAPSLTAFRPRAVVVVGVDFAGNSCKCKAQAVNVNVEMPPATLEGVTLIGKLLVKSFVHDDWQQLKVNAEECW